MNPQLSTGGPPTPATGAAALDDELSDLLEDLTTEEMPVRPGYVAEEPRDLLRDETVTLTVEEIEKFVRPEQAIRGRTIRDDVADGLGRVVDEVLLAPLRAVVTHFGFLVSGAVFLVAVAFAADWLLSSIMGNFQGNVP